MAEVKLHRWTTMREGVENHSNGGQENHSTTRVGLPPQFLMSSILKTPTNHINDAYLSTLCWHSQVAFHGWKAAGCPTSGPIYEKRKQCKQDMSSCLSKCRACMEYLFIQKRDKMFHSSHPKYFKSHSEWTEET